MANEASKKLPELFTSLLAKQFFSKLAKYNAFTSGQTSAKSGLGADFTSTILGASSAALSAGSVGFGLPTGVLNIPVKGIGQDAYRKKCTKIHDVFSKFTLNNLCHGVCHFGLCLFQAIWIVVPDTERLDECNLSLCAIEAVDRIYNYIENMESSDEICEVLISGCIKGESKNLLAKELLQGKVYTHFLSKNIKKLDPQIRKFYEKKTYLDQASALSNLIIRGFRSEKELLIDLEEKYSSLVARTEKMNQVVNDTHSIAKDTYDLMEGMPVSLADFCDGLRKPTQDFHQRSVTENKRNLGGNEEKTLLQNSLKKGISIIGPSEHDNCPRHLSIPVQETNVDNVASENDHDVKDAPVSSTDATALFDQHFDVKDAPVSNTDATALFDQCFASSPRKRIASSTDDDVRMKKTVSHVCKRIGKDWTILARQLDIIMQNLKDPLVENIDALIDNIDRRVTVNDKLQILFDVWRETCAETPSCEAIIKALEGCRQLYIVGLIEERAKKRPEGIQVDEAIKIVKDNLGRAWTEFGQHLLDDKRRDKIISNIRDGYVDDMGQELLREWENRTNFSPVERAAKLDQAITGLGLPGIVRDIPDFALIKAEKHDSKVWELYGVIKDAVAIMIGGKWKRLGQKLMPELGLQLQVMIDDIENLYTSWMKCREFMSIWKANVRPEHYKEKYLVQALRDAEMNNMVLEISGIKLEQEATEVKECQSLT